MRRLPVIVILSIAASSTSIATTCSIGLRKDVPSKVRAADFVLRGAVTKVEYLDYEGLFPRDSFLRRYFATVEIKDRWKGSAARFITIQDSEVSDGSLFLRPGRELLIFAVLYKSPGEHDGSPIFGVRSGCGELTGEVSSPEVRDTLKQLGIPLK